MVILRLTCFSCHSYTHKNEYYITERKNVYGGTVSNITQSVDRPVYRFKKIFTCMKVIVGKFHSVLNLKNENPVKMIDTIRPKTYESFTA